jgi:hypothetical protein
MTCRAEGAPVDSPGALVFPFSGELVARPNRSDSSERPKGGESAPHRLLQPPQAESDPRVNDSSHHVREQLEPRLIASRMSLSACFAAWEGIGGHRITDTTKSDQAGIRLFSARWLTASVASLHCPQPSQSHHAGKLKQSDRRLRNDHRGAKRYTRAT